MKDTIRKQIKEKIKNIPSNKKQGYSFCITQKIIEKFGHLENRHIYISMPDEVDTTMLISHLQQIGKKTFSCNTPDTELPTIDIIIVPGRAFDKKNNRLGRGKGYYDKFLAQQKKTCPAIAVVGICFPEQIIKEIPIEDYDISMDEVITHKE